MEIECKLLGELDYPNSNGRVYPKNVMEKAIKEWKEKGSRICELNPNYEESYTNPSLLNACGFVEDVKIKDNKVFGEIQLLQTPQGKIAKQIIDSGHELIFTPRIIGNIENIKKGPGKYTDKKEIKDIKIISFDLV